MALDSRLKRASVVGVGRPWNPRTHPSSMVEAQRPSVGNTYPVNASGFENPTPPQQGFDYVTRKRRRRK